MLSLGSNLTYHLYKGHCDMRKSFDGLCGIVRSEFQRNPASGEVFIFLNRRRTHIKLLHWEAGGFVLYYKRLEKGTFVPPVMSRDQTHIKWPELVLMIEGIQVKRAVQNPRY